MASGSALHIFLTGSTDGIGLSTAQMLGARENVRLMLHGRNPAKGAKLLEDLLPQKPASTTITYHNADLSSLKDVVGLSKEISSAVPKLDILINNAGIGAAGEGEGLQVTSEGHELRLTVNCLAPYLLSELLLPLLSRGEKPTVLHVTSLGQAPFDFDDPHGERSYEGLSAYRKTKFAMTALGFQQANAERWKSAGILINCIHPGTLLNTKIVRDAGLLRDGSGSPDVGAKAITDVLDSVRNTGTTGTFFNESQAARAHEQTYDPAVQQRIEDFVTEILKPCTSACM